MKLNHVPTKGKRSEQLQKDFDKIIAQAQMELLEATITNVSKEIQDTTHECEKCRDKIFSIEKWKNVLKSQDDWVCEMATKYIKMAESFVENFYFK